MTDQPTKRQRSLSTEYDDGEQNDHWISHSRDNSPLPDPNRTKSNNIPPSAARMSRPRRVVSGSTKSSITVARAPSRSPDDVKKSIRLTVKMPSSKLREATSGGHQNVSVNSREAIVPGEILSGPRGSRAKRSVVIESASDEEEDDDILPIEEEDEDAEEESDDQDDDGDVEMDYIAPPPPVLKTTGSLAKPSLTLTPAHDGKLKSVEAKEMELGDDDDEELSELDSEADGEAGGAEELDAEGEELLGEDEEMDQDDEDMDSDGRLPAAESRASTPDVSKMTKRQRSRLNEVIGGDFLQLPMEPQTKKHLTAEEHAMRRSEMARRRKNLSEKRNEEEKMDTINRLLKKQAPKRRGKISASEINAAGGDVEFPGQEFEKPRAAFVRWVSDARGCRVGVPEEWLGGPAGRVFGGMVEEVEG